MSGHLNTAQLKVKPNQALPRGFTIVELLIVITVIGILAAIVTVAYRGISNRANDTAVQSDLKSLARKMELYKVDNDRYPVGNSQLATLKMRLTKKSYSQGFYNTNGYYYNVVYCRDSTNGPYQYAFVAQSQSGKVITYKSDSQNFTDANDWSAPSTQGICNNAGINQLTTSDRDIFYNLSAWMSYVGG